MRLLLGLGDLLGGGLLLPDADHVAVDIAEEGERAHAGDRLPGDRHRAPGRLDLLLGRPQVHDADVADYPWLHRHLRRDLSDAATDLLRAAVEEGVAGHRLAEL